MRSVLQILVSVTVGWLVCVPLASADEPPSAVSSVMNLLKSGKVPPERLQPVLDIVCTRGNEHDLAYAFQQALGMETYPVTLRVQVLEQLASAARNRKVVPAGDLSGVAALITSDDARLQMAAIALAGEWKVDTAVSALSEITSNAETTAELRNAALGALVSINPDAASETIARMTANDQPFAVRAAGIAALAKSDLEQAATLAAPALSQAQPGDDVAPLVGAFLERQGGPAALAGALEESPPSVDVAKLALRHMYSVGRSDADLSKVLEEAAGIAGDIPPPTAEELAALIAEVETSGDAARGEAVFRRDDLSCMKCHAVSGGGGQIGPDLSPLGANSPVDYIIKSIFDPDSQIKEAFVTKVVLTSDGLAVQGIVADRTADTLVLKDADGRLNEIPLSDIDDEIEGKSLMPKGLVKFMTHAELVDLVRFLSELGKPGDYAIRATPRMQRWRVLSEVSPELNDVPNEALFEDQVLLGGTWRPAYAHVNGELPLDELAARSGQSVHYVQGEINVSAAGAVGFRWEAPPETVAWVDSEELPRGALQSALELASGRHKVTFRVDIITPGEHVVRLELFKPQGSTAEFSVVDGQ
jgi:putative heme-binding domain-containing protein